MDLVDDVEEKKPLEKWSDQARLTNSWEEDVDQSLSHLPETACQWWFGMHAKLSSKQ